MLLIIYLIKLSNDYIHFLQKRSQSHRTTEIEEKDRKTKRD
jgi:hypothetical protein